MKYFLDDADLQKMAEGVRTSITEYYKDEVETVPDHIIDTLCQNYVMELKQSKNPDFEKLLKDANFYDKF